MYVMYSSVAAQMHIRLVSLTYLYTHTHYNALVHTLPTIRKLLPVEITMLEIDNDDDDDMMMTIMMMTIMLTIT